MYILVFSNNYYFMYQTKNRSLSEVHITHKVSFGLSALRNVRENA